MTKSKRTNATDISPYVKQTVWSRDMGCCIFCGTPVDVSMANAHVIPRSSGGLGIEQNIVTLCVKHHMMMDQTSHRKILLEIANKHLQSHYSNIESVDLTFKKGR